MAFLTAQKAPGPLAVRVRFRCFGPSGFCSQSITQIQQNIKCFILFLKCPFKSWVFSDWPRIPYSEPFLIITFSEWYFWYTRELGGKPLINQNNKTKSQLSRRALFIPKQGIRGMFTPFYHYLFREFTSNSLSIARIYFQFTNVFANSLRI